MLQATRELVVRLAKAAARLPQSADEVCRILADVQQNGDPFAAPGVAPLLLEYTGVKRPPRELPSNVLEAASATLTTLMSSLSGDGVADFDQNARSYSVYADEISTSWRFWKNSARPNFASVPDGPAGVWLLGLLASDRSGFVREDAVRALARRDSGEELPFLLWRTTDWVAPVRERALTAVHERLLSQQQRLAFAKALPLVRRLEDVRRTDCGALADAVYHDLRDEPEQASLMQALSAPERSVRRAACYVLNGVLPTPPRRAVEQALSDDDALVRQWTLRWETRLRSADPELAAMLRERLLGDSSPGIRANALRVTVNALEEDSLPILRRYLADTSAAVRLCARYHLRRLAGETDFAAHYRTLLSNQTSASVGAVAGLGETGGAEDFDALPRFLHGPSRQVKTTLKALTALDKDRARPIVWNSLIDPRPGVRRTALDLLGAPVSEMEAPRIAELWTQASADSAMHLTQATLRLPPWTALEVLLSAVDQAAGDAAIIALAQWRPQATPLYLAPPPPEELGQQLRDKLRSLENRLPKETSKRLAAVIL